MRDFSSNPSSSYSLQLQSLGSPPVNHNGFAVITTWITTTIPGDTNTLWRLTTTRERVNGVSSTNVDFFSPYAAQTIFASDFIAGPDGTFSLDPSKRHITIPFNIPASQLGYQFAVTTDTSVSITPEPSTVVLGALGLIALAAIAWRRRRSGVAT